METLVGVVAGAVLGLVVTIVYNRFQDGDLGKGGELSGRWEGRVQAGGHKPYERVDVVRIRQGRRSSHFSVSLRRIQPQQEVGSVWKGRGYVDGNDLVIMCWPATNRDRSSFGTIVLHRQNEPGTRRWSGHYVRPATDSTKVVPTQPSLQWVGVTLEKISG